jgi:hypothetical protein
MEISLEKIPEKTQNSLTLLIYLKIKESKKLKPSNNSHVNFKPCELVS